MINVAEISEVPVAIIGMACRLPGAETLDQLWDIILNGRSVIGELPPERFDQDLFYDSNSGIPGKTYSKLGGVLVNRTIDARSCPLPASLVNEVDTSHLLMCEVAARACRHGRLDPFALSSRNVGVFVGHNSGSRLQGDAIYGTHIQEATAILNEVAGFQQLPQNVRETVTQDLVESARRGMPTQQRLASSMVAGTISEAFGLSGPALALDSACASSLEALLVAARALQQGRVEMAIVGGASDIKPDTLVEFAKAQAASATGSRPFDAAADGVICAEGYVAVVVKTLPQALADGDPIQAIVRSFGISSDGRGKGLWAPSPAGQVKAIQRAYRGSSDLSQVQYIEAHATSTPLGDGVELRAVTEALKECLSPGGRVPISSLKGNLGHTLEAAGLAGLVKTVLCMQHAVIPPATLVDTPNPAVDWNTAPVSLPQSPTGWPQPPQGQPRRAGVNAFGIGGLNMHVVLEEYCKLQRQDNGPRSTGQLRPLGIDASQGDDIAIVGWGCVLPGALNIEEFQKQLRTAAKNDRRDRVVNRDCVTNFHYDWRRHKIPPKQIQQADPLQFFVLDAVDQAMIDAGFDEHPFDRTRTGVVVGTEFGGDFTAQLQLGLRLPEMGRVLEKSLISGGVSATLIEHIKREFSETLLQKWPALIDDSGSFHNSALASRITRTWDLMGGAAAIDSGASSAVSALATAADLLRAGDCDIMICAAGQRRLGRLFRDESTNFQTQREASTDNRIAQNPGEGAGAVVLKRLSDARRDGDRIHCVIRRIQYEQKSTMRTEIIDAAQGTRQTGVLAYLRSLVEQFGDLGGAVGMVELLRSGLEIERGEHGGSAEVFASSSEFTYRVVLDPPEESAAAKSVREAPQVVDGSPTIPHFDATLRRRKRTRDTAAGERRRTLSSMKSTM